MKRSFYLGFYYCLAAIEYFLCRVGLMDIQQTIIRARARRSKWESEIKELKKRLGAA